MWNNTKQVQEIINDKNLYELLRRKEKFSEFISWTYEEHFKCLINEILELQQEIQNNWNWVSWEVADVVYMVWQLLNKMNQDWLLKNVSFKKHKEKIMWRSPNLKKCQKVSRETEDKTWYLLKNK